MKASSKLIHASPDIAARVDAIDWTQATADLDGQGCAVLKGLLSDHLQVAGRSLNGDVFPGSEGVKGLSLLRT